MSQSIKKYINLSIILGLLMLFFVEEAIAQYDTGNLQKYWYYRHRLVNYFTQVGPGDGESLIIDSRNKGVFGDITSSEVNFGDQVIYLGRYIGILATEYKLLDDNGQDVSQTAKELFYAMDAFNRLDLNAETLKYNIDPVLDGFFIREDVPVDFITNPSPLNKDLPEPPPDENYHTGSGKPMWVNSIENAGQYHDMSQDQVYGMMVGLALVSKLVPDDDTYNGKPFQDGHTKFVDEAVWITDRMIDYIRSTNWIIRDPNGDKVGSGPDAFYFSFGTAIAAAKIVNNPIISFGYLDNVSGSPLAENVWQTMQQLGLLISRS